MFIPGPWSFFTWICTVKGWVVLQSGILGFGYLAACYVLRRIAFPFLKGTFEQEEVYNLVPALRDPILGWIADVKVLFYGALGYAAMGLAGIVGAIFQIGILLVPYAIYLLVSWLAAAKKIWDVLQTVLAMWDKLHEACNVAAFVFGGNCDESFETVTNYSYLGAGVLTLLQATTLICTIVLIRRNKKKTGSYLFTFCGHACGGSRKSADNDLEKGIPLGRRRRGAQRALLASGGARDEAVLRAEKIATIPTATFSLARRHERDPAARQQVADVGFPSSTFELGRSSRKGGRTSFSSPRAASSSSSSGEQSGEGIAMRSLGKKKRSRRQRRRRRAVEEEEQDEERPRAPERAESIPSGGAGQRSKDSSGWSSSSDRTGGR
ncbi:hypothetical protein JCM6882_003147 [Rhodosporidiobolus microsporus]